MSHESLIKENDSIDTVFESPAKDHESLAKGNQSPTKDHNSSAKDPDLSSKDQESPNTDPISSDTDLNMSSSQIQGVYFIFYCNWFTKQGKTNLRYTQILKLRLGIQYNMFSLVIGF